MKKSFICTFYYILNQNFQLTFSVLDQVHLGGLRSRGLSRLVDCNHPELHLTLLLQVLNLENQRLGACRCIPLPAVFPICPAFQLLLDDVVRDFGAAIALWWRPEQVHGGVVVVSDLGCAGLTGLVCRGVGEEEGKGKKRQN